MRILGVDPGTYRMGAGVIDAEGDILSLLSSDVLIAGKSIPLQERLHTIYIQLISVIEQWHPDVLAVEDPFVSRNPRSALAIGQAQAVAFLAASASSVPVATYTPRQIKLSVVDYGGATKIQVQEMVAAQLGQHVVSQSLDATDALATAICHANHRHEASLEILE